MTPARQHTIRQLSPYEMFFTAASATVWMSARLRGPLDRHALEAALRALRAAFPVLSYQIELGEAGFQLVSDPDGAPGLAVREGPLPEEPELRALALGQGLVAVDVVSDGDQHIVSFGGHHGVADARAVLYYGQWFWSAYTQVVTTGEAPKPQAAPVPAPPEEALRGRGVAERPTSGAEKLDGSVWGGRANPPQGARAAADQRRITLDPQTTAALRAAGKARGLSLHGAVCGAVVKAERALVAEPATGPVLLGVRTATDVRDRVVPPIGIVESTNLVAMAFARLSVTESSDPFELGGTIVGELAEDVANGVVQQQIYHALEDLTRPQAPSLYITNVGVLDTICTPEGLVVEEIRGNGEIIMPEAAPGSPESAPGAASTYMVYSYGGGLVVEARYPGGAFHETELDLLAAEVARNLRQMAGSR